MINTPRLKRDDQHYRSMIIEHALQAFHQHGIKGVTMSQLAAEMRISKRTLYEVYESKEELLLDCLKFKHENKQKEIERIANGTHNVLEVILQMLRMSLNESYHINPVFITELHNYKVAQDYFAKLHDIQRDEAVAFLKQGIADGVFVPQTDFSIVYDMSASMVDSIFALGMLNSHSIAHVFASTLLCYIRGCATEAGRQIIDRWLEEINVKQ